MTVSVRSGHENRRAERPIKAPASRTELLALLILGLIGLLTSGAFIVFISLEPAPQYWTYVGLFILVQAGASLGLLIRSYFRRVEFYAAAQGMLVEMATLQEEVERHGPLFLESNSTGRHLALARQYGDGLLASGDREYGRRIIQLTTSLGVTRSSVLLPSATSSTSEPIARDESAE